MMSPKPGIKIPEAILKEFIRERRIVLPDETRGLWPVPIELIKNEAFVKALTADKEFMENYELAVITKTR